eukprot:COSAG04_NODE_15849_length_518_cov_1.295943_2_plen_105_part_01
MSAPFNIGDTVEAPVKMDDDVVEHYRGTIDGKAGQAARNFHSIFTLREHKVSPLPALPQSSSAGNTRASDERRHLARHVGVGVVVVRVRLQPQIAGAQLQRRIRG